MATAQPTREEEYLIDQSPFRENAFNIIEMMLDLCNQTPGSKHLVDEILHCIFFLGQVNNVRYTPEEFISDKEMLAELTKRYPRPLQMFSTQLPKRSPFSCVMDMIVMLERPENEDRIKQRLTNIAKDLKPTFPVSFTMCVSEPPNRANKYYGVSLSTVGPNPGIIVLAAACLSNWDDYVADAVMTYYPGKEKFFRQYFDGRMNLPENVRCQAFRLSTLEEMNPCRSCRNLFGLQTSETRESAYGNCAETESLSNLLKNEQQVKNQTRRESPTCTPENRQRAEKSVLDELRVTLGKVQFKGWHGQFYDPQ